MGQKASSLVVLTEITQQSNLSRDGSRKVIVREIQYIQVCHCPQLRGYRTPKLISVDIQHFEISQILEVGGQLSRQFIIIEF